MQCYVGLLNISVSKYMYINNWKNSFSRALCQKFPRKHPVLMNFLASMLRDEGGLEYKAAIVDTIIAVMEGNAEAKEAGLAHLCEFIEDCEHIPLAVRILHLLGQEGPTSKQPPRYIRFIYNRIILESASVRAAAVTALAHFAAACPALLPNILVLLSRCQLDADDEVRDRATYYCTILQQNTDPSILPLMQPPQLSIPSLERALRNYVRSPMDEEFDISQVKHCRRIFTVDYLPSIIYRRLFIADARLTRTPFAFFIRLLLLIVCIRLLRLSAARTALDNS
jgi:coatomer protein complex subunit gamma